MAYCTCNILKRFCPPNFKEAFSGPHHILHTFGLAASGRILSDSIAHLPSIVQSFHAAWTFDMIVVDVFYFVHFVSFFLLLDSVRFRETMRSQIHTLINSARRISC
ncbi:hypothetical protein BJX61DRAFT_472813 [Aspergillus egyptiacus]|nr:hypothetical protein BJX61DRAFT_472813 [Aspergillus egyptiacus]